MSSYKTTNKEKQHHKLNNIKGIEDYPYYATIHTHEWGWGRFHSTSTLNDRWIPSGGISREDEWEQAKVIFSLGNLVAYEMVLCISWLATLDLPDDAAESLYREIPSHFKDMTKRNFYDHEDTTFAINERLGIKKSILPYNSYFRHGGNFETSTGTHIVWENTNPPPNVLGDWARYWDSSRNDIIKRVFNTANEFTMVEELNELAVKFACENFNIDQMILNNLHSAVYNDDFESFINVINDSLYVYDAGNDEPNIKLQIKKLHFKDSKRAYGLPIDPLRIANFYSTIKELGDRVVLVPMGFRSIGTNGNPEYIDYIQPPSTDRRRKIEMIDTMLVVFKDEEAIEYLNRNVYGMQYIHPACGLLNMMRISSQPLSVKKYNRAVVNSLKESTANAGTVIHTSPRKTFFDKHVHQTYLEIKCAIPAISVDVKPKASIADVGFANTFMQNAKRNDWLNIDTLLSIIQDNALGFDINAYFSINTISDGSNIHQHLEHNGLEENDDIMMMVRNTNPKQTGFGIRNLYKKPYTQFKNKTLIDNNKSFDEWFEFIYAECTNLALEGVGKAYEKMKHQQTQRWMMNNNSNVTMVPIITICVGMNNTPEQNEALKKFLKKCKVLGGNAFAACNVYPYLCEEETIEDLLNIIRYI